MKEDLATDSGKIKTYTTWFNEWVKPLPGHYQLRYAQDYEWSVFRGDPPKKIALVVDVGVMGFLVTSGGESAKRRELHQLLAKRLRVAPTDLGPVFRRGT
jgi:hypothetical protein